MLSEVVSSVLPASSHSLSFFWTRNEGPRTGSRQKHHSTAIGKKSVTIFAVMTRQRKQLVACCLTHKLLLCVRSSRLGHRGTSTSVPSCATIIAIDAIEAIHSAPFYTFRRHSTPSVTIQRRMQPSDDHSSRLQSVSSLSHNFLLLSSGRCWATQFS